MSPRRCAAVILAAGLSRRMGALKPLLPLGDGTIAEHVISTFQKNDIDVYFVIGHRRDEVKAAIKKQGVTFVDNPDHERGMFTSVQAGVRNLGPHHESFFVLPADIPLVRPSTVARLLSETPLRPEKTVYPVFEGRRGHPVLIPSRLAPSILGSDVNSNLKAVLNGDGQYVEVPVPDRNVLFDVDSPEGYRELLTRFERNHIPTEAECDVILTDSYRVAEDVRRHCLKVTEVAVRIGEALELSGTKLDIDTIKAAAMLHDIAKGKAQHALEGERILRSLGFDDIGAIVGLHMDLPEGDARVRMETKVVFLADKLVRGVETVTIEDRYSSTARRLAGAPEVETMIMGRMSRALNVAKEIETLLGQSLSLVVRKIA